MRTTLLLTTIAAAAALSTAASAAVTAYVSNPTTNLEDWTAATGPVVTNINFDDPNVNASLTFPVGDLVTFGAGPGQGNTSSPPLSPGEGPHAPSNFLFVESPGPNNPQVVTETFTTPVAAAGVDTIDYFGASEGDNFLDIAVYSGPNGTGTLLGSATSAQFNFQPNNIYFMGFTSTSADIGSFVFSRVVDTTGDTIGLDNFVSSGTGFVAGATPEPTTWAMMLLGVGMIGSALRFTRRSDKLALTAV